MLRVFEKMRRAPLWRALAGAGAALCLVIWWRSAASGPAFSSDLLYWCAGLLLCAVALAEPIQLRSPDRATLWAVVLICAFAILRLVDLGDRPVVVSLDEAEFSLNGWRAMRERPWATVHGCDTGAIPLLGECLQALFVPLLDPLLAIRLASVIQGLVAMAATFSLARRWFGVAGAFAALGFLGCSYWHMLYSALGLPMLQPPFAAVVVMWVLVRAEQAQHRMLAFTGGMLLGASTLLYTPSRIVVPLVLAWWGHLFCSHPQRRRHLVIFLFIAAAGALLFLLPHLREFGFDVLVERFREVAAARPDPPPELRATTIWTRAWRALGIFYSGDVLIMADGHVSPPLLDIISRLAVAIGLLWALVGVRETRCFVAAAWVLGTFVAAQLLTDLPSSAYRAAAMLPGLGLCVALAAERLTRRVSSQVATAMGLVALSIALPSNLRALSLFDQEMSIGSLVGRLIARGDPALEYYVVSAWDAARDPVIQLQAGERRVATIDSLMDFLGRESEAELMVIAEAGYESALSAVRRCYPGAELRSLQLGPNPPVIGLVLSPATLAAGVGCRPASDGPGLRARYFASSDWSGAVVEERVEDWPYRFHQDLPRYRSVEWIGSVRIDVPGWYVFKLVSEAASGGFELGGDASASGEVARRFTVGTYSLRARCRPHAVESSCSLMWEPPGGQLALITPDNLVPAELSAQRND